MDEDARQNQQHLDGEIENANPLAHDRLWNVLTVREQQIATLLAIGQSNQVIAKALKISVKTVDTHRGHILKKLGVKSNTMLAHYAIARGWVELQANCTQLGRDMIAAVGTETPSDN